MQRHQMKAIPPFLVGLIAMPISGYPLGHPLAAGDNRGESRVKGGPHPKSLVVETLTDDTLSWDEYAHRYTLNTMRSIGECIEKKENQKWFAATGTNTQLVNKPDGTALSFPVDRKNRSMTALAESFVLHRERLGPGDDVAWVILSIQKRSDMFTHAIRQLKAASAWGEVIVMKGVKPSNDGANQGDFRSVVTKGWRDHGLAVAEYLGNAKRYIFVEDDIDLCVHGVSELVSEAKKAPLMWLAYNQNGAFGAQMWSLSAEALGVAHEIMRRSRDLGWFDLSFLKLLGAPKASRSYASTFEHVDYVSGDTTSRKSWNCSNPDKYLPESVHLSTAKSKHVSSAACISQALQIH